MGMFLHAKGLVDTKPWHIDGNYPVVRQILLHETAPLCLGPHTAMQKNDRLALAAFEVFPFLSVDFHAQCLESAQITAHITGKTFQFRIVEH